MTSIRIKPAYRAQASVSPPQRCGCRARESWAWLQSAKVRLAAVIAASLATFVFVASASACNTPGLYFDGMLGGIISTQGAQAYIDRYDPRACISSSAWSMIDNQNSSNELAQVGWLKLAEWSPETVYYFYEYGQSSTLYGPKMISAVPEPKKWQVADHFAVYMSGGNAIFTINSNGVANQALNWTPNNVQWFSETHSYSDQTAGDTERHVEFYGTQHLYNGSWYNSNAEADKSNDSPYGAGTWGNGAYMWTWDTRFNTEY